MQEIVESGEALRDVLLWPQTSEDRAIRTYRETLDRFKTAHEMEYQAMAFYKLNFLPEAYGAACASMNAVTKGVPTDHSINKAIELYYEIGQIREDGIEQENIQNNRIVKRKMD